MFRKASKLEKKVSCVYVYTLCTKNVEFLFRQSAHEVALPFIKLKQN